MKHQMEERIRSYLFIMFGFVVLLSVSSPSPSLSSSSCCFVSASSAPTPPPVPILSNSYQDLNATETDGIGFFNFNVSLVQYQDPTNISAPIYSRGAGNGYLYGHYVVEETIINGEVNSGFAFVNDNGICRVQPSFSLIPNYTVLYSATFEGYVNVTQPTQGNLTTECQVWNLSITGGNIVFFISNVNNTIPIRIFLNLTSPTSFQIDFSPNYTPNPIGLGYSSPQFIAPPNCFSLYTCPLIKEPLPIEVYNFHGVDDFWLNNTNVADLLGDTFFLCTSLVVQQYSYFQWISQWQVMVNATWGQYSLCNFGQCFGGDATLVGREAAYGFGLEFEGQCTDNSTSGTWYSLPGASECLSNQTIGDGGCTWQVLLRSKTINASCILDNPAFVDACTTEFLGHPLTESSYIFAQAFLSDDPNQGGCPPLDVNGQSPNGHNHLTSSAASVKRIQPQLHNLKDDYLEIRREIRQGLDTMLREKYQV